MFMRANVEKLDMLMWITQSLSLMLIGVQSALKEAYITQGVAVSQTFQILYKHEDLLLADVFGFTVQMLIDSNKV